MNTKEENSSIDPIFLRWCTNQCHEIFGKQPDVQSTRRSIEDAAKNPSTFWFLMAWNIFERKCLAGDAGNNIRAFLENTSISASMEKQHKLQEIFLHFHNRYGDKKEKDERIKHLFRKPDGNKPDSGKKKKDEKKERFEVLMKKDVQALASKEKAELLVLVVYRFRNNIFHGVKSVPTWKQFSTEITHCTEAIMKWCEDWKPSVIGHPPTPDEVSKLNAEPS